jgi:hypothetical protein
MRISSNPDDAFYSPHMDQCRIWLEGGERNNVETADEGARFAVQLARDEFGHPVLDKDGNQIRQKFYGAVRIECPDWLRASQEHDCQTDELSAIVFGMIQSP